VIQPALFAELQKLCLRSFPERLDQRISQVETLASERHPMLGLTLSWRKGHQPGIERLIVRRYGDRWTWWTFDDPAKAQREWTVLRWLYGEGFAVPKVYALGSGQEPASLLMARAPGRPCAPIQGAGPAATLHERHIDALAGMLADLHQRTPPDIVREVLPNATVAEELRRMAEMVEQGHNDGMMEAVDELSAMLAAENVEILPSCVLHGDVHLANVLGDARGITALLDWENCAFGDPRWDVVCVVDSLHSDHAEGLADRFCAAYAGQAAAAPAHLPFWQALVALHRWTVGSRAQQYTDAGLSESQVGLWGEKAWRTLTRLRYARREA
jgi:aminoglycoside phosphotransferase (APT) family kinase protein